MSHSDESQTTSHLFTRIVLESFHSCTQIVFMNCQSFVYTTLNRVISLMHTTRITVVTKQAT